ncbi:erythronolide synthase [Actinoplanes sp. SE50/110]|uniref:type I polyketide synthase n=1 Tax=Actinoplanes sp. (strain ATCC 31044 / CBS 674.73 / SE50/110) TaxID=134676 RepID=UPI00023EC6B0|nr:type I polyketide synthase [Actinoplanes sp. SE50/110]AEV87033.1 erythronolide synthase [Actinoplanes sp. SE50/110]
MTSETESADRGPLRRAMATIRTLQSRLAAQDENRPVAIVGAGLRLPGGITSLAGYWDALAAGRDLVAPMPAARQARFAADWATLPRRGAFLDDVLGFDAAFFGLSPREARHLDPQHRLLMEVAWEALEDAALPADRLGSRSAGLFLGIMWQDYRDWQAGEPDAFWTTGNGHNFAAGRIAYTLGLTGPTLAVDTACSSSLVALHLAVQALRRGECEVALAGGVNLILSPRSTRLVVETRSLAPDGRCKSFDAAANGFTRGEGCGVVVLKSLDAARRDGDRIHAVIHGSAVNQDGRSGGFTVPNVLSQVRLIEDALADARLTAADIGFVETHGTGTALGDPIEVEALAAALGRRNGGAPLPVGAGKTNLGHLESAAGVAGLLKAVLSLRHRQVPPVVHFRTLNPRIDLDGTGIVVPARLTEWAPGAGRYAGVSSFGMSGTNAHVVLGAAEPSGPPPDDAPAPAGFEISARTEPALRELAARYAARLATLPAADFPALASTTATGRSRLAERAWIAAAEPAAAAAALRELAEGWATPQVVRLGPTDPAPEPPPVVRRVVDLPNYPWQRKRYEPEQREQPVEPAPLFTLDWRPAAPAGPSTRRDPLVVAGDDTRLLELIVREAAAADLTGTVLGPLAGPVPPGWDIGDLPADRDGWSAFWSARTGRATVLLVPAATPLAQATSTGAARCAAIVAAVGAAADRRGGRTHLVTRATRQTGDDDRPEATDHGLLHGLAPTLGLEYPDGWGGVVDLPADPRPTDVRPMLDLITADDPPELTAVRAGVVLAARLTPARPGAGLPELHPDATYLVTGGLGAVGRHLTAELVARGARHLLIIGRRPRAALPDPATGFLAELAAQGVDVHYRGDGCDTAVDLAAACAPLAGLPPVRGILHLAGTVTSAAPADLDPAAFAAAAAAKAGGAWLLHRAAVDWPLDFFVLVSSVSALWGSKGHAAYAAANGALDLLAAYRRGQGLPATSVAYGPWALDGEGMADRATRERAERTGIGAMGAAEARSALAVAVPGAAGHVIACRADLVRLGRVLPRLRAGLLAGHAEPVTGTAAGPVSGTTAGPVAPPAPVDAATVRDTVAHLLAVQLGYDGAADIRPDMGFADLGLDSINAVDLAERLTARLGRAVPVTALFDHPSVAELTAYLTGAGRPAAPAPPARPWSAETPAAPAPPARPWSAETPAAPAPPARPWSAETSAAPAPPARPRPAETPAAADPTRVRPSPGGEPIAIVGMACRFPQADSAGELWELLDAGIDAVGPAPADRWGSGILRGGRVTTDQGGYLRGIDLFDAGFFDVPAREARSMDPQQRLLMETAWHALEDAGIAPSALRGTATGVFVGISYADYARLLARGGADDVDAYYGTGTALNATAGRLAYALGLHGPALAVDTACSSSLVAAHLAVRALRAGEADAALVGGVNILLDPMSSVAVSQAHMLAPDGRCRTFDADADGFVRAEGCGVLVLKRLADARRDGDDVLAVIRGSAVNSDGASSGLTVPNGSAQERLLTAALADAGLPGHAVSYLEAHGTGTRLGDPIEVAAAWRALGPGRDTGEPLLVGSVKSNIGHCESAAGLAGIVKVLLALRHGRIPANLHFRTPNPHVDWAGTNVRVVAAGTPWPRGPVPRVAGVSGFGFTGTNAHLVLADPDQPSVTPPTRPGSAHLVTVSAPDPDGLARVTAAWHDRLTGAADGDLAALAAVSGRGRTHFRYRRSAVGRTGADLARELTAAGPVYGAAQPPRVAFLFTGQGSQYFGMGRDLYETEPAFREVFDRCDDLMRPRLGTSLTELVFTGEDAAALHQTRVTQPALVALALSLVATWRSWGVEPATVLGHSVGEIAAAVCAGILDLPAACEFVVRRAELMQSTGPGRMLSVPAPEKLVEEWIRDTGLDLAAVNGPEATVVAGPADAIEALAARLSAENVRHRPLATSHAFHSRLMDPILDRLRGELAGLRTAPETIPLVANLTGQTGTTLDAEYWCEQVRRPVRFHDGLVRLGEIGADVLLEIGPDRTLTNLAGAAGLVPAGGAVSSLRRGIPARTAMLTAAAALYRAGQRLDFDRVHPTRPGRVDTPRYPFARTSYWVRPQPVAATTPDASAGPAWGTELRSPALPGRVFASHRSTTYPAHLTDHRLFGTVSVPGASQLATVLSALSGGRDTVRLQDVHFPRALVLHEGERYEQQVIESAGPDGRRVTVQSLVHEETGRWQEHLVARLPAEPPATGADDGPRADHLRHRADRELTGERFYRHLHLLGYHLGPSFRWIDHIWIAGDQALVRLTRPVETREDPGGYAVHPGLLDSCLQSAVCFAVDGEPDGEPDSEPDSGGAGLAIPFSVSRLAWHERPAADAELWAHVRVRRDADGAGLLRVGSADIRLTGPDGRTSVLIEDFRFRYAPRALVEASLSARAEVRRVDWTPVVDDGERPGSVTVLGSPPIETALREAGLRLTGLDADVLVDARFTADRPAPAQIAAEVTRILRTLPADRGYAFVGPPGPDGRPVVEAISGLLAGLRAEQPDRRVRVVEPREGWRPEHLAAALTAAIPEDGVLLAAGPDGLRARHLTGLRPPASPPVWDTAGSALITGGLGALGLSVASFLVARGVRHLTLMARSGPDEPARQVLADLATAGATVQVLTGDVTDPADCRTAVEQAGRDAPVRFVLHLAGTTDDRAFDGLTPDSFDSVFAAKVTGAVQLAAAVGTRPLTAFVLFSSASAVLGSAGQANYAAANGYLDGLATVLRGAGVPATSVGWGPWSTRYRDGLADTPAVRRAMSVRGLRALTDEQAWPVLDAVLAGGPDRLVVVAGGAEPAVPPSPAPPAAATDRGWLRDRLGDPAGLRAAIGRMVGEVLGDPGPVDPGLGFMDLGLDSIMTVDLQRRLSHALGRDLPVTVALDHPTVDRLAAHIEPAVAGEATEPADDLNRLDRDDLDPLDRDDLDPLDRDDLGEMSLDDLVRAVRADVATEG